MILASMNRQSQSGLNGRVKKLVASWCKEDRGLGIAQPRGEYRQVSLPIDREEVGEALLHDMIFRLDLLEESRWVYDCADISERIVRAVPDPRGCVPDSGADEL